jgi:uncharacterized iron-regulated membrane protein
VTVPRSSHHDPVFVDRTGRRRRLFALGGTAGGLLLAVTLLALLAGFTGAGPAVLPDWSDAGAAAPRRAPARPAPSPAETPRADPTYADAPAATGAVRTSSPATTTAAAEPAATGRGNGRTPTHTPSAKPGRKR